jgi:hypothetical protein
MRRGHHLLLAASAMAFAGAAGAGETVTYGYDSLGRLTRVSRSGTVNGGVSADYRYDAADNRSNVTVAVPGAPAPIALVVGGGFEAPDQGSGFLYRPTDSFTGNSGIAANGSLWGFAAAPEGDQVAFIQNGPAAASVSLLATGLVPGASYIISFRMSARPGYAAIPLTLAFNGIAIGTFEATTHGFAAWTSPAFTATAGSGTLTFTGIATADNRASGLDMVTIAAAGGQP